MCRDGTFALANDQHTGGAHRLARSIRRARRRSNPAQETWDHCGRPCGKSTPALAKEIQRPANRGLTKKAKDAFVSESALHVLMAVSRILSADLSAATIIYLTQLQFCSRRPLF